MKFLTLVFAFIMVSLCGFAQDTIPAKAELPDEPMVSTVKNSRESLCFLVDSNAFPLIFKTINTWLYTPYHFGGLSKSGIDCSGFVKTFYKEAFEKQIHSRASREMYNEITPLPKAELALGDLVFFKIRKGHISHVGVYLGNNKFVHSSTHKGVVISDLNEPYYKRTFYSGGRHKSLIPEEVADPTTLNTSFNPNEQ